ncbi:MAG TPA: NUDIX domain-containing protein [Patescibacteria group bacterium]|nr:NUDIX domain-containing protein [Patescibacteria group bacterium]
MDNITPSAAALVIDGDQVLLVRTEEGAEHITGMYGLPSGRVDEGETEKEAARRELEEESGIVADLSDLSEFEGNYYQAKIPRKDGSIKNFGWRVFRVSKWSGELGSDGNTTPEWVSIAGLEEFDKAGKLLPNTINAINAALRNKNND